MAAGIVALSPRSTNMAIGRWTARDTWNICSNDAADQVDRYADHADACVAGLGQPALDDRGAVRVLVDDEAGEALFCHRTRMILRSLREQGSARDRKSPRLNSSH